MMSVGTIWLFLAISSFRFLATGVEGKGTVRLGVLLTKEDDSQDGRIDNSGYLSTLYYALQTVNDDPSLQYEFTLVLNNSKCEASSSLHGFIDQVTTSPDSDQIMLIGADCSVATEPVAELAYNWNLVQISPGSSSPRLSNDKQFPLFLRTVSSDAEIAVGITAAMKEFGWSRIALLTQSENIFTFFSMQFRSHLDDLNMKLVKEFIFNTGENVSAAVNSLRDSPARIIFLNMYQEHAIQVLCMALQLEMVHPTYQWMLFNWYTDDWLNAGCAANNPSIKKELEAIVETALVFDHYPRINEEDKDRLNVGNTTWNEFASFYNINSTTPSQLEDSAYVFDAIWTAALTLNNTASKLPNGITLKNFTYENRNMSQLIYEEALKVNFFGLTGSVSFRSNGDRPGRVRLIQYRRDYQGTLTKMQFGRLKSGMLEFQDGESGSTVFQGEIAVDEEHIYIALPLFVTYTSLSILGILFALGCLIFNLLFREQKLIKLTSPYVNVMIIAGAVVVYITIILYGVDENVASSSTVDHLCQTKVWLAVIGFSLLFGTIFAKTWRIYYIFCRTKPNSKLAIKDIYLFIIIGLLILVDIVVLIPPTVLPDTILKRMEVEHDGKNENDLPVITGICTSDNLIWLPVLLAYKGFFLLAGLFLAFETRKVKYTTLNESRFIAASIYGAVTASIALIPIELLLNNFPNLQYGIAGSVLLLSITLILVLVFVSKMYKVYCDPEGVHSLDNSDRSDSHYVMFMEENYQKKINNLNSEIKALNEELTAFRSGQISNEVQLEPNHRAP